jgi:hypothetical protein
VASTGLRSSREYDRPPGEKANGGIASHESCAANVRQARLAPGGKLMSAAHLSQARIPRLRPQCWRSVRHRILTAPIRLGLRQEPGHGAVSGFADDQRIQRIRPEHGRHDPREP